MEYLTSASRIYTHHLVTIPTTKFSNVLSATDLQPDYYMPVNETLQMFRAKHETTYACHLDPTPSYLGHLFISTTKSLHSKGNDHASSKDVIGVLAQLGVNIEQVTRTTMRVAKTDASGDNDSWKVPEDGSPASMAGVAHDNDKKGPTGHGGVDEAGSSVRISPQDSGASLFSQFPPTQEMPRAVTQSPIPLPPTGDRRRATPDEDDAMRMSPPSTAR